MFNYVYIRALCFNSIYVNHIQSGSTFEQVKVSTTTRHKIERSHVNHVLQELTEKRKKC